MGVRRTFETTAALQAFVTGYSDGINTARTILLASAAVARAQGQIVAAEVTDGLAGALGEHVDEFVAENEGKTA